MLYFCADDYGISRESNRRIVQCMTDGVLNKISVLPNGDLAELSQHFAHTDAQLSLHLNLVEGRSLSAAEDIPLLVAADGSFRYSFVGLLRLSLSPKRREMERQLYTEIKGQVDRWKELVGADAPLSIDSHQHAHMIPLVFKTLMRVIREEALAVSCVRIPAEPLAPYLLTPSLYGAYSPKGLIKQWLLKFLFLFNRRELRRAQLPTAYFMGVLFSGHMTEKTIQALLPHYLRMAAKHERDVEIALHPGYVEEHEQRIDGSRAAFSSFYLSPWRRVEFDTLVNFKKEGKEHALY